MEENKIIFVDIDGTICGNTYGDYEKAKPIKENIDRINQLYDEGNTIVYWTARGSQTKIDWHELTAEQLKEWSAKHHGLILGKPHYDLYIDDKSINAITFFNKKGE
tara:strand:- start:36441 stop:36758 length:318 start_codon:yes stop_codon:yes gene_type:complete